MNKLFTVGHSNHDIEHFIGLLKEHAINAIADVRQLPYSKYASQFNKEALKSALADVDIEYVFMGDSLGARPTDIDCYANDRVDFHKLALASFFLEGMQRLNAGIKKYKIALMCAEKDPIMCHRTILVCRNMRRFDLQIIHILEDATLEDNKDSEKRLLQLHKMCEYNLFQSVDNVIEDAYDRQGVKMAATITNLNEEPD